VAAVASSPIGVTVQTKASPPPQVSPETWEAMRSQEREFQRSPERWMPTQIKSTAKYVFRTDRGSVRGLKHLIPTLPYRDADPDDKKAKVYQRAWQRARRFDPPGFAELIERVVDDLGGGDQINFRPILTRTECIYETDSDNVAAYIRILMKQQLGEFAHVYEQQPRSRLVVGEGEAAMAFPYTPQGMAMAQTHMAKHGLDVVRVVKDED
jgi:hypothetical protein